MSFKTPMHEIQFKTNKNNENYNWEYFKAQINKSFQNQNKTIYSQRKIDVEPVLDL